MNVRVGSSPILRTNRILTSIVVYCNLQGFSDRRFSFINVYSRLFILSPRLSFPKREIRLHYFKPFTAVLGWK